MSLALFLARRLPLHSSRRGEVSGIAVSVTGIAMSVTVMLLSISVMMGFRDEIRLKIIGFDSQITIAPQQSTDQDTGGVSMICKAEIGDAIDKLKTIYPEAQATLTVRQPIIVKTPDNFSGAIVKGADTDCNWDFVRSNLVEGVIPDYSSDSTLYHIVVSRTFASSLGLKTGDKTDAYFLGGGGTYRTRRLTIAGIYDTHFSEYDRNIIFATLPMITRACGLSDTVATLAEINGLPNDEAIDHGTEILRDILMQRFYDGNTQHMYSVVNIHDSAALYFNWLALLDTNVIVILTLMALLAGLALVSSLFILILRRVSMIGILKALGASNRLIQRTFILLTLRVLAMGLIAGNAFGLAIIILQRCTGFLPLDPEAYYLDHVPMAFSLPAVLILNAGVAAISFIVLLLPSAIVSTISPSRAINYE